MKTNKEIIKRLEQLLIDHSDPVDYNDCKSGWELSDSCYYQMKALLWVLEDSEEK